MGWVWLIVIGAGTAGALALLGVGRGLWSLVGAALMLGATGYALQGRPGEAGSPAEADAQRIEIDPGIVKLRGAMMGNFTAETPYLAASDAMIRSGAPDAGAAVMLAGIRKMPRDMVLWTGLGDALAQHDGGVVSPASLFAFRRAMALAPKHPAPPFFLGLAYVRAGEFAEARPYWARALDLTPGDASYRPEIAVRLMLLDRFLAVANGEPPPE
ncbi:tetratricopeptide repeat protein [Hephaestia caeni]|uniref:Tetratricopeptide repeat protein n=2 Tax=Hephaestia caeni TaxID=645617 RepID=A0A397PG96_9SPHN|nr:tetratricopeptide repeat protein [Hephaestia caeni]RIA46889.1 tetratricopeptide repeat protein [Hephaestia caeni]